MTHFRNFSVLLFFLIILGGCEKEQLDEEYVGLWMPWLSGQRFENSVLLDWYKPMAYPANIIPPNYATPDYTDIYSSQAMDFGFEKVKTVKGKITSVTIEGLNKNVPYYFYVVLRKRGFDTQTSGKIMVIPSETEKVNHIYDEKRYTLGLGGTKNGASEIAFTNWNFQWEKASTDYNAAAVIIYSEPENKTTVVDTFSNSPAWAPNGNLLIYVTDKNEVAVEGHRPSHLVVYNPQENTFQHFPDGDNEIRYPTWKDGDKSVVYVKNSPDSGFEIWEMDLQSGTKTQLISDNPFSDNTLLNPDKPDVSSDNKSLFFEAARSTDHGGPLSVWQYSFQTKSPEFIFPTEWDDSNPAISPDGEKLAFVSDRSGNENIWLYNLVDKRFRQITGSKDFYIRNGLGRISWADSHTIVFCGGMDELEGIFTVSID